MNKEIMLVLIGDRKESAVKVQQILTGWGCMIKTRLGLHDDILDNCSESGLLILEVVGDSEKNKEIAHKLNLLKDVDAKLVSMSI
jgi:hypothetical protein